MDFSYAALWHEMGVGARMVVITLALMSIYSLGVMVERLLNFRKARRESMMYAEKLARALEAQADDVAVSAAQSMRFGYLPKVLGSGLREYSLASEQGKDHHEVMDLTERAMDRAKDRTVSELKRGLGGLGTIGSSAPFVGLFGTVLGIINAFELMAAKGSGGLATVSAGIAEALITTAFGLLVAIPAVAVFNYFTNTVEQLTVDMGDASGELLAHLARRGGVAHEG